MNRLKWYSSKIWDQEKYEELKSRKSQKSNWYAYLIGNTTDNFGAYFPLLKKVIADNGDMEILFLTFNSHRFTISADVLLTNTRSKVLNTRGIPVYMAICRMLRILNQKRKGTRKPLESSAAIQKIHEIYPSTTPIADFGKLINTVLKQKISSKTSEQYLWNQIIIQYFSNVIVNLSSSNPDIIVKALETSLKTIIGEIGNNPCIEDISSIIDYSKTLGSSNAISKDLRHNLLADLGIKVCPYCNRNYVTWYRLRNQTLVTADLDHYYQKDYYPLFALSLFNFVPSCQVCNSRLKGTNPMEETLYPFEDGFDEDAFFKFQLLNPEPKDSNYSKSLLHSWLGMKSPEQTEYKITIETKGGISDEKRKRIEGSKRLFRLEEIYSTHVDKALDISLIARCYDNPDYKHYCDNALKKLHGQKANRRSLFEAYYDCDWMSFGYHWHAKKGNMNFDAPLSRMTWDIFQQYRNQQFP
jgi:hypothetical protein